MSEPARRPIANVDDIVTCDRGHPLYRIAEPIFNTWDLRPAQFESISPRATPPKEGTIIDCTCRCGADWYLGRPMYWGTPQVHFEEGWRPGDVA